MEVIRKIAEICKTRIRQPTAAAEIAIRFGPKILNETKIDHIMTTFATIRRPAIYSTLRMEFWKDRRIPRSCAET
jgi:hypothetical protein